MMNPTFSDTDSLGCESQRATFDSYGGTPKKSLKDPLEASLLPGKRLLPGMMVEDDRLIISVNGNDVKLLVGGVIRHEDARFYAVFLKLLSDGEFERYE